MNGSFDCHDAFVQNPDQHEDGWLPRLWTMPDQWSAQWPPFDAVRFQWYASRNDPDLSASEREEEAAQLRREPVHLREAVTDGLDRALIGREPHAARRTLGLLGADPVQIDLWFLIAQPDAWATSPAGDLL